MTNRLTLARKILFILIPSIVFITSLALYAQSIEGYEGGFDANFDYVIVMAISLIWVGFGVFLVVKPNEDTFNAKLLSVVVTGAIFGFYSLGLFFKGLAKHKEFSGIQIYLYAGLVGVAILAYSIVLYFENKKK